MPSRKVTISNRLGLHARPAMLLAERASTFSSTIRIARADAGDPVDGKSIMQLMMLAAVRGTELTLTANGPDAETALEELAELVNNRFNEDSVEGV